MTQHPHSPSLEMRRRASWAAFAPLMALFFLGLGVPGFIALNPRDPHRLAAVFPPWWSGGEALAAAASVGAVTGVGGARFIIAIAGDAPDLATALHRAGALFVMDGRGFAYCGAAKKG